MRGLALGKPTHPLVFPTKVGFWCVYMTPLEPILSKIRENIHKRSPLRLRASVRSTELLLKQKCGKTPNTQWTRFCENIFLGKGFRKISANSFEMFWVWIPPAERGLGNECGRKLFGFLAGRTKK
jgi:hypothetical protein